MEKNQRITLEAMHSRLYYMLNFGCTTSIVLHLDAFTVALHHQIGSKIEHRVAMENVMTNYMVTYIQS